MVARGPPLQSSVLHAMSRDDSRCSSSAGMELYPRIGKHFDLKTWTNCRMGMMGWAVIILCYAAKQRQAHGAVADSLLVSVALMQIYIAKFFLCERCPRSLSCTHQPLDFSQKHAGLVHSHMPCSELENPHVTATPSTGSIALRPGGQQTSDATGSSMR